MAKALIKYELTEEVAKAAHAGLEIACASLTQQMGAPNFPADMVDRAAATLKANKEAMAVIAKPLIALEKERAALEEKRAKAGPVANPPAAAPAKQNRAARRRNR